MRVWHAALPRGRSRPDEKCKRAGGIDDHRIDAGLRFDRAAGPRRTPSTKTHFDSASLVSPSSARMVTLCTLLGELPVRGSIR